MNETVKKLVDGLILAIQGTVNFVNVQLPDVVKQLLAYNAAMDWMWIIVGAVFMILATVMIIFSVKCYKNDNDNPICLVFGFIAFICLLIGIPMLLCNIPDLLKIYLAPKLYLLDYLKTLIVK